MPRKIKIKKSGLVRMYLKIEVTPEVHTRLRAMALDRRRSIVEIVKDLLEKGLLWDITALDKEFRHDPTDDGHL